MQTTSRETPYIVSKAVKAVIADIKQQQQQPISTDDNIKSLLLTLQKIVDLKNNYTTSTPKNSIVDQLNPLITTIKDILNKLNAPTDTLTEATDDIQRGGNLKKCFDSLITAILDSFRSIVNRISSGSSTNSEIGRRKKTYIITDIYPSIINPSNPQLRTNMNVSSIYGTPIKSSIQDVDEMLAILKSIANDNTNTIAAFNPKNQKRHKITIEDSEIVNKSK